MSKPEDPQALIGAVLGKQVRLTALLGEGGLALVYRGEPVAGGEPVAVKVLRAEFRGDSEVVQRFLSEADLAKRIAHPGVLRVHGGFRAEDGTPYLVTELLRGEPLSAVMNRGPMPVAQAVRIVLDLLDALTAAHLVGVVHRDLKPDNVFVEPGEAGAVRLLDFGISRAVEAAGGSARRTKTGMLLGTPGYMSPEQVRNSKDADQRSDLFSTGVLFFELITQRRAFDGNNDYERMMAVLFADARPIDQVAPQFAHWRQFFDTALNRNLEGRFQSAEEMRSALRGVAESGHMPLAVFGGDRTALSPAVASGDLTARPVPEVVVLRLPPRKLAMPWVLLAVGTALVIGFIAGLWTGGS